MVKAIKRLLGIEDLETKVAELEKQCSSRTLGDKPPKLADNVLDEWVNGAEESK